MPSKQILEHKKKTMEDLGQVFESSGVYLFDYRGLSVKQMNELRVRIKELGANVKVFKNRLAIKYFEKYERPHGRDVFKGPMAVAYADENFIEVAKVMVDYAKENEKVELKAGFIEKTFVEATKLKEVAKLPGRDQLLAQLAGAFTMPLKKMGMTLSAPLRNVLILMNNLKDKKEKEENTNG